MDFSPLGCVCFISSGQGGLPGKEFTLCWTPALGGDPELVATHRQLRPGSAMGPAGEFVASNSRYPSILPSTPNHPDPLFPHKYPRKSWVLISHAQSARHQFHIMLLLNPVAAWQRCNVSRHLSSAPARWLSPRRCCFRQDQSSFLWQDWSCLQEKRTIFALRVPQAAPLPPALPQRCQYISIAPWRQHPFFFSKQLLCSAPASAVQVLEPIFPRRVGEGSWRRAREQEDGIAFKGDCEERRWCRPPL